MITITERLIIINGLFLIDFIMECFGTTDFDNNSRLITLSAIIISGLHCIYIYIYIYLYIYIYIYIYIYMDRWMKENKKLRERERKLSFIKTREMMNRIKCC